MALDRRDFLKLASLAGLSVAAPVPFTSKAHAQESILYDGLFFINIHAGGGWDPTSLCDPKGMLNEEEENPMNASFMQADIMEAGNIRYAPLPGFQTFFDKYYQELLVINGLDTSTNGHDSGTRNVWSGKLSEGTPSFSALVAAAKARVAPMAFLSNGGYDYTGGLVAPTRSGNTNALARIAFPNRPDTNNNERLYHTEETAQRIAATQQARLEAMRESSKLPARKAAMNTLYNARVGENEVRRLTDFLPQQLDNSGNPIIRQAQLALASYKAGLSVSVNITRGGFDTHGNHDQQHIPRLLDILNGIDFIMEEAERLEIRDKVVIAVGSDFGRTPRYNGTNGKDHWSITSMMFLGAGITGNRVIGGSTHEHVPYRVDPSSLETLDVDGPGIRVTPEHVHRSLRRLADIHEHEFSLMNPLNGADDIPLFG
jgi:uncharacterized protein (DUF1501 family)